MGYSRERTGRDGKPRYTAYYWDVRGRERSAGTFSSKKAADKAWQGQATKVDEGRAGDPRRGRQTFQRYVEEWLPDHVMALRTRENYTSTGGSFLSSGRCGWSRSSRRMCASG